MLFYKDCFGGDLGFQMVGECPQAEKLPEKMKGLVVNATLKCDNKVLMGTDMVSEEGLKMGNGISIWLECRTRIEMEAYYQKLARNGSMTHPIKKTFWGGLFGGLTDRYGHSWLFHCKR